MIRPYNNKHQLIVWIRIRPCKNPEKVRWALEWIIMRAASFRGVGGFNNDLARRGRWHSFVIGHELVERFKEDIRELEESGVIQFEIAYRPPRRKFRYRKPVYQLHAA